MRRGYRLLVFKTSSFGRSDNLPCVKVFHSADARSKRARRRLGMQERGTCGDAASRAPCT